MAARSRGRRRLQVGTHSFLWYVAEDYDGYGPILHLYTPDKHVLLFLALNPRFSMGKFELPQPHVRVGGTRRELADAPRWPTREVATPGFVREVADWLISAMGSELE